MFAISARLNGPIEGAGLPLSNPLSPVGAAAPTREGHLNE